MRVTFVRLLPALMATLGFLMATGCTTVEPSVGEPAPETWWHVKNLDTGAEAKFLNHGLVDAKPGETIRVVLEGRNPGGVQVLILHETTFVVRCEWRGVVSERRGSVPLERQDLTPLSDGKVLTSIILIRTFVPDIGCAAGSRFIGTDVELPSSVDTYPYPVHGVITAGGALKVRVRP